MVVDASFHVQRRCKARAAYESGPLTRAVGSATIRTPRSESRRRHAKLGPYLCGPLSLADAFYAPVAFRFQTYDVHPTGAAAEYLQSLLAHPFLKEWERDALAESTIIEADEPRVVYRAKLAARG